MEMSVTDAIKHAEKLASAAFTLADGRAKSLKYTQAHTHESLGNLILAAANNAGVDVNKSAIEIKSQLAADIQAAVRVLDDAMEEALKLSEVSDYLENGGRLDLKDFALVSQATAVREAHIAGLIDGRAVAADIRRYLQLGTEQLEAAKGKWAKQTISAADVAGERIKLALMEKAGEDTRWQKMRVDRKLGLHRWNFGSSPAHIHARQRRLDRKAAKSTSGKQVIYSTMPMGGMSVKNQAGQDGYRAGTISGVVEK